MKEYAIRVPEHFRQCSLFLGVRDANGRFIPKATAFVVSYRYRDHVFLNLVTAEHVLIRAQAANQTLWGRVNCVGEDVLEFGAPYESWYHHPDATKISDVAVLPFRNRLDHDGKIFVFDIKAIPLNGDVGMTLTPSEIAKENIGVGDEVAVVGLFRSHYGRERNHPIVRIGNIAAMNDEPVQIKGVDVPRFRGQFCVFCDRIFVLPPRSYTAGQSHAAGGRSSVLRTTDVAR